MVKTSRRLCIKVQVITGCALFVMIVFFSECVSFFGRTISMDEAPLPTYVIGIPSVRREHDYISDTFDELVKQVPRAYKGRVKFVILNGNTPAKNHTQVQSISLKYSDLIESKELEIIESEDYAKLKHPLRNLYGDDEKRLFWRSKQSLDFARLMKHCSTLGKYYIHLEDDIEPANNFIGLIDVWIKEYESRSDWIILSTYSNFHIAHNSEYDAGSFAGFIGQIFRARDLAGIGQYFEDKFDLSPVDWLMRDYVIEQKKKIFAHSPSLFQHLGKVSSLKGKVQDLQAQDFDKNGTINHR